MNRKRISVVTCDRDRTAFATQYALIAQLGYTGEYSIWCNEIRQSSWRRWFERLQQRHPTQAQVTVNTVHSIPCIWPLTRVTAGNPWQSPYWHQQIIKLYDAWQNPNTITVSLDSKTWPIHPEFYLTNSLLDNRKFSQSAGPFSRTQTFVGQLTGKPTVDLTRGNLPPWPIHSNILRDAVPDWQEFIQQCSDFDWQGSTFSEYYLLEQLYGQRGYTGEGHRCYHIVYTTYGGDMERLDYLLHTGGFHYFTHKWHDPTETDLVDRNSVTQLIHSAVDYVLK